MGTGWRRAFCTSISRDPETTSSSQDQQQQQQQRSSSFVKLGINNSSSSKDDDDEQYSSSSASSTPRFRRRRPATPQTLVDPDHERRSSSPKLECKIRSKSETDASSSSSSSSSSKKSPSLLSLHYYYSSTSSSASARSSPSRFALLKAALRLSRNRCGVCGESTSSRRTGSSQTATAAVAVFTAECSHSFHFPCISAYVKTHGSLVCPVCSATWHDSIPFLSSSLHLHTSATDDQPMTQQQQQQQSQEQQHLPSPRNRERSGRIRGRQDAGRATAATAGKTNMYDDDESLHLSPAGLAAGGALQFNPIPEGLETEEEEVEDEDGDRDNERAQTGTRLDSTEALSVMPDSLALVSAGRNHLSYVVSIKVKVPSLPPKNNLVGTMPGLVPPILLDHPSSRAPIDLVTVLDVSGSMTAAKLQMLKRAMRLVISSLGPGDRLSIVAFSVAAAKRLLPLRRMSKPGQRSARQIVDRLVICGTTQAQAPAPPQDPTRDSPSASCVGDALRKATKVLEDRRERNPVATIMLLSEGHRHVQQENARGTPMSTASKNRGECQPSSPATRFTHIEIPIQDSKGGSFDMQQKQSTDTKNNNMPVMEEEESAFAKRVNGLVSVVLQDVRLQFVFPASCGEISSVYSCSHGDGLDSAVSHGEGGKSIFLGDMRAGEERQLFVELKVPKATLASGHAAMSMSALFVYRDPRTQEVIRCGERPLVMPTAMPVQSQNGIGQQPYETRNHQLPAAPMLFRSNSSCPSPTAAAATAAAALFSAQQQQQVLRNLFVTTRAMVESRRLVDIGDLDTAIYLLSSARSLLLQQSKADSNSWKGLVLRLEARLEDLQRQQQQQQQQQQQNRRRQPQSPSQRRSEQPLLGGCRGGGSGDQPLTPTSAWRAAEQLAKVAIMRKSLNRVSDLHGLENARF